MLTRYVTYRHPQNPFVRFRELLKDVPKWAVDIKEEKEVIEMTDKELLELAAKAAGIDWDATFDGWGDVIQSDWNPLTDDGDALRLAVKLGMGLWTQTIWGDVSVDCHRHEVTEKHNKDPYAATRRAIVRAAAEIGRQME